jgi:hypothetical protein
MCTFEHFGHRRLAAAEKGVSIWNKMALLELLFFSSRLSGSGALRNQFSCWPKSRPDV